jgi:mRNA interferase MazF
MVNIKILKGDVFLTNLEPIKGHEQGGVRPALIIQNNLSNQFSPLTIVAPITSKIYLKEFPTNVFLSKKESGLDKDSTILLNQIRTIDKTRLIKKISSLDNFLSEKVDNALKVSLGLD